jgi:hypothetical protein
VNAAIAVSDRKRPQVNSPLRLDGVKEKKSPGPDFWENQNAENWSSVPLGGGVEFTAMSAIAAFTAFDLAAP